MTKADIIHPESESDIKGVSIIIRHKVCPEYRERYELWLKQIIPAAAKFPGHQGVYIMRPMADGQKFEISVRFSCEELAYGWLHSVERKMLLDQVSELFHEDESLEMHSGIDFWFTQPSVKAKVATRWKQWLITTAVIWPLTMLIPALLKLVYGYFSINIHWVVQQGIAVAIVVALVVYVVMPRIVKLVASWLFR
jgi:antibiotic biosynthesis monooxygenase (ABM) superfamily enzyme